MNYCLCCDRTLLKHIHHGQTYWYCPHCRQAMPGVDNRYSLGVLQRPILSHSAASASPFGIGLE